MFTLSHQALFLLYKWGVWMGQFHADVYNVQRKDSFIEILYAAREAQKELCILQQNILVYSRDTS